MPWPDHGSHSVTGLLDRLPDWKSIGIDCRVRPCNDLWRDVVTGATQHHTTSCHDLIMASMPFLLHTPGQFVRNSKIA